MPISKRKSKTITVITNPGRSLLKPLCHRPATAGRPPSKHLHFTVIFLTRSPRHGGKHVTLLLRYPCLSVRLAPPRHATSPWHRSCKIRTTIQIHEGNTNHSSAREDVLVCLNINRLRPLSTHCPQPPLTPTTSLTSNLSAPNRHSHTLLASVHPLAGCKPWNPSLNTLCPRPAWRLSWSSIYHPTLKASCTNSSPAIPRCVPYVSTRIRKLSPRRSI